MANKPLITPAGRAVYPHLHAPDTKFNADGIYSTKLALEAEVAAPLMELLTARRAAAVVQMKEERKGKKTKVAELPFTEETDKDGKETGAVLFNFKMKARVKAKQGKNAGKIFIMKPALIGPDLKPLPEGTRVGGGSTIKVAYETVPFHTDLVGAGVSLRLVAVQVLELKTFDNSGARFGFGVEGEGIEVPEDAIAGGTAFAAEEPAAEETAPAAAATESAEDADF